MSDSAEDTTSAVTTLTTSATTLTTSATDETSADTTGMTMKLDVLENTTGNMQSCQTDGDCVMIDLLFVIDNSGTMGEEQLNLAKNFAMLITQLEALEDTQGNQVGADVNIMVTTTDMGNPSCNGPWVHDDYVPANGSPIATACTERMGRFTSYDMPPVVLDEACTDVCDPDDPVVPSDQFIHFDRHGDNVENGDPAHALACLGPQGIDGCGYESPLEAMAQALNPTACWNDPDNCEDADELGNTKPFLRDGAVLAIAIITDEADCSVRDYSIMADADFQETNPTTGAPGASSAICWHAGVACTDLEPETGKYSGCVAVNRDRDSAVGVSDEEAVLQPLSRYVKLLDSMREQGREVIMLGVLGVPEVTEHAMVPPFQPIAGGVRDIEYRTWQDPEYPDGDILPDEWADGVRAVDKQFEFGIGPGCTGVDDAIGEFTGQAVPPVRVRSVCESLDVPDDPSTQEDDTQIRCCIESICDEDFSPAIRCMTGLIQTAFTPVG